LVDVPFVPSTTLAKPIARTVFVFVDGQKLEADRYELHANFLHVSADGQDRSIPLSALDMKKTVAINRERGINLKIPSSDREIFLAF